MTFLGQAAFLGAGRDHQWRKNSLSFLCINSTEVALADLVTIALPLSIAHRTEKSADRLNVLKSIIKLHVTAVESQFPLQHSFTMQKLSHLYFSNHSLSPKIIHAIFSSS
jgi:hypothetical protein